MSVEPDVEEVHFTADLIIETMIYVKNEYNKSEVAIPLSNAEAIQIATTAVTIELNAEYISQVDERLRTNAVELENSLGRVAGAIAYTATE